MRTLQYLTLSWIQPDIVNVESWRVTINNQSLIVNKSEIDTSPTTGDVSFQIDTLPDGSPLEFKTEYNVTVTAIGYDKSESNPSSVVKGYIIKEDINNNGAVDGADLAALSSKFGGTGVSYRDFEDITGDGNIDGKDLSALSSNFGDVAP